MNPTAERFEKFHKENPIVYITLTRLMEEWIGDHRYRKVGIRMLWETSRWMIIKKTNDPDYKLNDHYTSYYVRLLIMDNPDFEELFELRRSPADEWAEQRMKQHD